MTGEKIFLSLAFVSSILMGLGQSYGFANPYHSVYVLNKTSHTFQVGTHVLGPQRQGILKRVPVSEDPFLQESFRVQGKIYFKGSKKLACSYDFSSYTLLNNSKTSYETFLLLQEKDKEITCDGVALEVSPGKNALPQSRVLLISEALAEHKSYKNHLLTKALLLSSREASSNEMALKRKP